MPLSFRQSVKSGGAGIARTDTRAGTDGNARFSRHGGNAGWHGFPLFASVLPRRGRPCADDLRGSVSRKGEWGTKGQPDFVRVKASTRRKMRAEAPVPSVFQPPENFFAARNFRLCGKKKVSFSKEFAFLPHKSRLPAREMRDRSISRAFFLTIHGFLRPFSAFMEERESGTCFPFARIPRDSVTFRQRVRPQNGKSSGSTKTMTTPMMICRGRPTFT